MGIEPAQCSQRLKVVEHHFDSLGQEMISEEEEREASLKKNIEVFGHELLKLCEELSLPNHEPKENLTLLELEKDLRIQMDKLTAEKEQRMNSLQTLKKIEQHLCDILCITPNYIPSGSVPSMEQLLQLQEHIDTLEKEKNRRHSVFSDAKRDILNLMEELEQNPDSSFEREIVCEAEDSFLLSTENMEALKQVQTSLEKKQQALVTEAKSLRDRLHILWDRLQIEEEEREPVTARTTGHRPHIIIQLKEEISRMEELKRLNMEHVMAMARKQLVEFWDKCFIGEAQRFPETTEITEELEDIYDKELMKMKQYYEENKELFEMVRKREVLWKEHIQLEEKSKDPSRLMDRKHNMLEETKLRNKVKRELPKLEEKAMTLINIWERENNQDFLIKGQKFVDYIQMQKTNYELEKQLEMEAKKRCRAEETKYEMRFGSKPSTPVKRRFLTTPNKSPSKRRKGLNGTVAASPSRLGATQFLTLHSPAGRPPRSVSKTPAGLPKAPASAARRTRAATRRALAERNHMASSPFSTTTLSSATSRSNNTSTTSMVTCGSYTDFSKELENNCKPNFRSSSSSRLPSPVDEPTRIASRI